jgi:hypothetical protein
MVFAEEAGPPQPPVGDNDPKGGSRPTLRVIK